MFGSHQTNVSSLNMYLMLNRLHKTECLVDWSFDFSVLVVVVEKKQSDFVIVVKKGSLILLLRLKKAV